MTRLYVLAFCATAIGTFSGYANRASGVPAQNPATAQSASNDDEGYPLRFLFDAQSSALPIIQVRINGEPPLPFVLDTGSAFPLVLERWAADKLHVQPTNEALITRPTKIWKASLQNFEMVGLKAGRSVRVQIDSAGVGDLGIPETSVLESRIAGIVGMPVFAQTTIRFDFAAGTLTVFLKAHRPLRPPNSTVLQLKEEDARFNVGIPVTEGNRVDFMIDTGSATTDVPESVASRLKPIAQAEGAAWGIGGAEIFRSLLLKSLRLGDFVEPNVEVDTNANPGTTPVLGLGLLSRFRVTLDFRNREMILERAKDYTERVRLPGSKDIYLVERNGQFIVDKGVTKSPAAVAGVVVGDKIVKIDGRDVDSIPLSVAHSLISGFAGTKAELLLQRKNGNRVSVSFNRGCLYSVVHELDAP